MTSAATDHRSVVLMDVATLACYPSTSLGPVKVYIYIYIYIYIYLSSFQFIFCY